MLEKRLDMIRAEQVAKRTALATVGLFSCPVRQRQQHVINLNAYRHQSWRDFQLSDHPAV